MIKLEKPKEFISPIQKNKYKAQLNEFVNTLQAKRTDYFLKRYSNGKNEPPKLIVQSGRRYDKIIEVSQTKRRNKFPPFIMKSNRHWYNLFLNVFEYLLSIRKHIENPYTISNGQSIYCFIEKETGNILKPAGWMKPAKHPRGNIFNNNMLNGLTYHGPKYLRNLYPF